MIEERSDIGSREFVCMMTKKKRSKMSSTPMMSFSFGERERETLGDRGEI